MDVAGCLQIDEDYINLLTTLLDDVEPTSSLRALPLSQGQTSSQPGHDTTPIGILPEEDARKQGHKRSSSDNRGCRGLTRQLQALQLHLDQQQHELQQQLRQKLYLTERAALLEQLIELREAQEERLKKIRTGLDHNPFAPLGSTVKKYPQLATYRPPAMLLTEIQQEMSLAEPINPAGMQGLPAGLLTVEVPPATLAKFAAAYSLDISRMSRSECDLLKVCAAVVVDKSYMSNAFKHAILMLPELMFGTAIHLDAVAAYSSWGALASTLSSMQLEHEASGKPMRAETSAFVAPEEHWQNVADNLGLTDKQKLQAAVLWEIISGAKNGIVSQRGQLAQKLSHMICPAGAGDTTQVATPDIQPVSKAVSGQQSCQQQQQQQQQEEVAQTEPGAMQQAVNAAAACCWLNPEQLTKQDGLMKRLHGTLLKERFLFLLAGEVLSTRILSPVQGTKLMVHSYPFMPAHLEIISKCAALCRQAAEDKQASEDKSQKQ